MRKMLKYCLTIVVLVSGCDNGDMSVGDDIPAREYRIGKNYYTTEIDGDVREYFVHVPSIYKPGNPTPVVFMLHGTSGFGEKYYNISGWKELGETENILTVYPSSWHYCIIVDGKKKNTTKWNIYPAEFEYCAAETPRDDIKFLTQIITELKQTFSVDNRKIYLVGFSNGGAMAGRCAVEMSDVFAAIVEEAGSLPKNMTYAPKRKMPVIFQIGDSDKKWLGNDADSIPMEAFDSMLNWSRFSGVVQTHVNTFGLESTYTTSGDVNSILIATYKATSPEPEREFLFILIKNMGHIYPHGNSHPEFGAELHWTWMKQFTLP